MWFINLDSSPCIFKSIDGDLSRKCDSVHPPSSDGCNGAGNSNGWPRPTPMRLSAITALTPFGKRAIGKAPESKWTWQRIKFGRLRTGDGSRLSWQSVQAVRSNSTRRLGCSRGSIRRVSRSTAVRPTLHITRRRPPRFRVGRHDAYSSPSAKRANERSRTR
jgi:hypothetical protein